MWVFVLGILIIHEKNTAYFGVTGGIFEIMCVNFRINSISRRHHPNHSGSISEPKPGRPTASRNDEPTPGIQRFSRRTNDLGRCLASSSTVKASDRRFLWRLIRYQAEHSLMLVLAANPLGSKSLSWTWLDASASWNCTVNPREYSIPPPFGRCALFPGSSWLLNSFVRFRLRFTFDWLLIPFFA